VEENVHEHVARAMYFFSIHLIYASSVGCATWILTSVRGTSATTKYWMWIVSVLNFVIPAGAVIDRILAPHLAWAEPLGPVAGAVWKITEGRTAVILGTRWMIGTVVMILRLTSRLYKERRLSQNSAISNKEISSFAAHGIPVTFDSGHSTPAVGGLLYPRILLPAGVDQLLSREELNAVLLHEAIHAKRRDNLIRLLYELSLCALWFHPLIWLAGMQMSLYRELSCDESVIRLAHGQEMVQALAKLAVPKESTFLKSAASSHLSHRLPRLTGLRRDTRRTTSLLITSLFLAVIMAAVFETIAHTACCFIIRH
jgi:beta-lactamase regulating signal transducer with metallopeptidase domain